jgi:hypothetical protein
MDMTSKPVDTPKRKTIVSRRLSIEKDAKTIANYSRPEFVLNCWNPVIV